MALKLISVFVLCVCVVECIVVQNPSTNKQTSRNTATNIGTPQQPTTANGGIKDVHIASPAINVGTGNTKAVDPVPSYSNTQQTFPSVNSLISAPGPEIVNNADLVQAATSTYTGSKSASTALTEPVIAVRSVPIATETGGVQKPDPIPIIANSKPTSTSLNELGIFAASVPLATGTGDVKKADPIPINVKAKPTLTTLTESGITAASVPLDTGTGGVKKAIDAISTNAKTKPIATGTEGVQKPDPIPIIANSKPTSTSLNEFGIYAASVPLATGTGGVKKADPIPINVKAKPTSTTLTESRITATSVPLTTGTGGVKQAGPTPRHTNLQLSSSALMKALNTAGSVKSTYPTAIGSASASSSVNGADPTKTYTNTKPASTLLKEPAIVQPPRHYHVSPAQPNTNIRQVLPLPQRRVTSPTTTKAHQSISFPQQKPNNKGRGHLSNIPTMDQLLTMLRSVQPVRASGTTNVATKTTNVHSNHGQPSNVAGTKRTYSNYPQYRPAPLQPPHHIQNAKPSQPQLANLPVKTHTKPAYHSNNYNSKPHRPFLHRRFLTPASAKALPPKKTIISRNQQSHEQYPKKYFTKLEKRVFIREVNEERADVDYAANMNVLRWNETLAERAAAEINSCLYFNKGNGAIYAMIYEKYTGTSLISEAVGRWADEKNKFRLATPCNDVKSCRYSQIVWANTREVGCARQTCNDMSMVACMYDPPGNVIGEQAYKPGRACSRCAPGSRCNTDNLCEW